MKFYIDNNLLIEFLNNNNNVKLFFKNYEKYPKNNRVFFFLFHAILFNIRNNKQNFENLLNRYIKFNRKNISIIIEDEKLLSIMN